MCTRAPSEASLCTSHQQISVSRLEAALLPRHTNYQNSILKAENRHPCANCWPAPRHSLLALERARMRFPRCTDRLPQRGRVPDSYAMHSDHACSHICRASAFCVCVTPNAHMGSEPHGLTRAPRTAAPRKGNTHPTPHYNSQRCICTLHARGIRTEHVDYTSRILCVRKRATQPMQRRAEMQSRKRAHTEHSASTAAACRAHTGRTQGIEPP